MIISFILIICSCSRMFSACRNDKLPFSNDSRNFNHSLRRLRTVWDKCERCERILMICRMKILRVNWNKNKFGFFPSIPTGEAEGNFLMWQKTDILHTTNEQVLKRLKIQTVNVCVVFTHNLFIRVVVWIKKINKIAVSNFMNCACRNEKQSNNCKRAKKIYIDS